MRNKKIATAVLLLSTIVIGACGNGGGNASNASSADSQSSAEVTQTEEIYQNMYDDSLILFESGKYSEAGGTIDLLLQNDLSEYADLEAKAQELRAEISSAQVESIKEEPTYELVENSAYKAERNSVLISQEYADATGNDILEASDEEIETWLANKEQEMNQSEDNQSQSSSESTESTESEESGSTETVLTPEEEEIFVLEQVIALTGISPENNQFFTSKLNEDTYQVEIRNSHEVDGVEISNMVGMFEYSLSTEEVKKMNPVTGEYEIVDPQ
ncbi:hypothetical protein JTF06_13965 [Desemzia sp. RIT804]|uniref:hypothetical protein n=1 Tax=Desemzia sp. RIT 804 TaxID=2810209 RepID=UPI00194FE465|nr:hypothetical protein [Desemzia sp. RIT 804]MBM6615994.1 hypothetical protein [Desemzia sp. RIT 804]